MTDKPRRGHSPSKVPQAKRSSRPVRPAEPEIRVAMTPAGRETLAAIEQELRGEGRESLDTLPYGDRVPNAPGATTPSRPPRPRSGAPAERRKSEKPAQNSVATPLGEGTEVFEVLTFLVRNPDPSALLSEESRRTFVEARILQRLPGQSLQRVRRIDVSPWTERETVVLRVWLLVESSE